MIEDVDPQVRAFLLAVLRFQTLRHRGRGDGYEYRLLRGILGELPVGSLRPAFEQRAFRRLPVHVDAIARVAGTDAPCTVLDLSGTGARIRDDAGIPDALAPNAELVLHLAPCGTTLRIFLAASVVHRDPESDTYGLVFTAPPVIAHQRIAAVSACLPKGGPARRAPGPLPMAA